MPNASLAPRSKNRLLARLPEKDLNRLAPHLQVVSLRVKDVLYRIQAPIGFVYFPISCATSAVTSMKDGSAIEVATVGNEGMVGLTGMLGASTSPNKVFIQVAGDALRMPLAIARQEASIEGPVKNLFALYHSAYLTQISFSVACNGLHTVQKRCCRWLLMTQDRIGSDVVALTHEFLGIMLGVRRASVTEVLLPLQERGLLRSERGKIRILDRKGMEEIVCECYAAVNDEYERLLGQ